MTDLPTTRDAIIERLDCYDWECAFEYAGEIKQNHSWGSKAVNPCVPGYEVSLDAFTRLDVAEVIYMDEGERDGNAWVIAGRLDDGRWFLLGAWCDYTGWD